MTMTHWVLITGGIGSGKTTVAKLFKQQQVHFIDTDEISRELTQVNGLAITKIMAVFGQDAIDQYGALNRDWMRHKIFQDVFAKQQLENVLHPMIFNQTKRQQRIIDDIYGLVVVPVFSEDSFYNTITERVLVIDVDDEIRLHRVQQRDQLSREEVIRIMASQLSREERLKLADDIIMNDKDEYYLQQQVLALHNKYLDLFS